MPLRGNAYTMAATCIAILLTIDNLATIAHLYKQLWTLNSRLIEHEKLSTEHTDEKAKTKETTRKETSELV